jgi:putative endonuclease
VKLAHDFGGAGVTGADRALKRLGAVAELLEVGVAWKTAGWHRGVRPDVFAIITRAAGPAAGAAKLWGMSDAWVYLLRCRDGSLYTGWTVNLERRLARHRAGVASRYTASRLPVELALAIAMPDRTAARREEARIKRLSRDEKLALLAAAR